MIQCPFCRSYLLWPVGRSRIWQWCSECGALVQRGSAWKIPYYTMNRESEAVLTQLAKTVSPNTESKP